MRKLWIVLPVFVTASMASAAYGAGTSPVTVAPVTNVKLNNAVVTQVPVAVVPQTQVAVGVALFHGTVINTQKAAANVKATATSGITFGGGPLIGK